MSKGYNFKSLESIIATARPVTDGGSPRDFVSTDYKISFDCIIDNPHPAENADALLNIPNQDAIRQGYLDSVRTPGYLATGIMGFYEYSFFENCALPLDVFRREAIIGEPICWGIDFAEWYSQQHMLGSLLDRELSSNYIDFIRRSLKNHTLRGEYVMLSAPGQEIYGHWLLDIVPRLYNLSQSHYHDTPILLNNLPEWANYFLKAFDINIDRILSHPSSFFKIEKAVIPSSSKSGYRLGGQSLGAAWKVLRDVPGQTSLDSSFVGEKIYFTRRHLTHNSRRSFSNVAEVEAHLATRGYKIVAPESLSIPQQIALMKEARVVIGEDGSALHNVIFCENGAKLGVLSLPERNNLWHLGICQLNGHRIAYFELPESNDEPVDIKALDEFVALLESA